MKKTARAEFVKSATKPEEFPKVGLSEVAFVGRSNVGKSSLLNQLAGVKKLAFVSKTPGRTQLINFFSYGDEMLFVDLPGYGFAKVPRSVKERWEEMVTGYLFHREALCLVLLLIDLRRDPMESDMEVRDLLARSEVAYAIVATKADKLSGSKRRQQLTKLERTYGADGKIPLIPFSAVTNEGRKEVWKVIERHVREAKRAPKS